MDRYIQLVKCLFGYHDFYVVRSLSDQADQLGCRSCPKLFAANWNIRTLCPWGPDFDKFYFHDQGASTFRVESDYTKQ
jgi:hypothetical protein